MIHQISTIAVVGAGTMGAGIAQLAAQAGCTVHLIDVTQTAVEKGLAGITTQLDRLVEKGRLSKAEHDAVLGRIRVADSIVGASVGTAELAIEAVLEHLNVKNKVFAALEQATPPSCVLATNTSSLSVGQIAEAVRDPSRVIGMHFFNPAPLMPLVEVIAGRLSAVSAVDLAFDAAKAWGKTPVRVKDTPGFIVNRVARGFYLEALRLLGEGVAGVDEIDNVMRTLGKFRMGPFELMDLIGVDVNLAVSTSVWEQMGKPARLTPHEIQRQLVDRGHFGRKANRGFFAYEGEHKLPAYAVERKSFKVSPGLADVARVFCERGGVPKAGSTEQYVLARILGAIMNEAGLALGEEVATAGDIDTAMLKGTNYPRGPLAWAEEIGHRNVRGLLKTLNIECGDGRYEAAGVFKD